MTAIYCDILWYVAYCNIIAILKVMQYDNCSSTLLRYYCPALVAGVGSIGEQVASERRELATCR